MAFSVSVQKGQFPITCQLCESDSKIQFKCIDCQLLMCSKCKDVVHPKFKKASEHRIVDIKEVGLHSDSAEVFDFSDVDCQKHKGQSCCLYCKTCKQLICPKCVAKVHNGHELVDEEDYSEKKKTLRTRKENSTRNLEQLVQIDEKLKQVLSDEKSTYNDSKQDILAHKANLKISVDQYTDILLSQLDREWNVIHGEIQNKQRQVNKEKERIEERNMATEKLITSKNIVNFIEKSDELEMTLSEDLAPISLEFYSVPTFVKGSISEQNVGILKNTTKPKNQKTKVSWRVIRSFQSDLENNHYILPCSVDQVWSFDSLSSETRQINIGGDNIAVKTRLRIQAFGVAVAPNKNILLSVGEMVLKEINNITGELSDSKYTISPYGSLSVHVTTDFRVIVGAWRGDDILLETGERVIIVMDKQGNILSKFEHDGNGRRLFTYMRSITTTRNGNICLADTLSNRSKGRVVVLGKNGVMKCIYSGRPDTKVFTPWGIVNTPSDNIIIADGDNHFMHFLDCEGEFITCFNTSITWGMWFPYSVAFSASGLLYVGCASSEEKTTKAKIFELEYTGR